MFSKLSAAHIEGGPKKVDWPKTLLLIKKSTIVVQYQ